MEAGDLVTIKPSPLHDAAPGEYTVQDVWDDEAHVIYYDNAWNNGEGDWVWGIFPLTLLRKVQDND